MNRRRSQQPLPSRPPTRSSSRSVYEAREHRISETRAAEPRAASEEPGPRTVDSDLERAFFEQGLSEDMMVAATERERDRDALRHVGDSRGNRWVYGVAGVGACAILVLGFLPRILRGGGDGPRPVLAVAPAAPAAAAPAPQAVVIPPAEAEPEADRPTVTASQLRGGAPVEAPASPEESQPAEPAPAPVVAEDAQVAKVACSQLLRRGKFADIKTTCGKAFAAEPDAALAVEVARSALERERYQDAQQWAKRAIELDGRRGEAFLTLGGAEQGLGRTAPARTAYARYLELEPNGPYADDVRALIDQL